jgi:ATP-binding cassette subfamily G (WHITE) protein 2
MTPRRSRTSFAPRRVARGNLASASPRRVPPNPPRPLGLTLLAGLLVLALPGAARAQSTAPSAPSSSCPVDISRVRLDDTLGARCDPEREDLCVSCVCDFSLRLVEAGYRLTGEDAVPFQACAMANIVPLQRAGLTVGGMMAVASRCTDQPPCVAEYEATYFPPPDPGPDTAGAAAAADAAPGPASAPDHSSRAFSAAPSPPRDPLTAVIDASASDPRDGLDGSPPDPGSIPRLRPPVAAALAAVVVVVASLAAWAIYAARERLRRRLHAAHSDDDASGGVERLTFENITCVAGPASSRGRPPGEDPPGPGGARVLLRGVTGACHRGEMLALMGPSGAGKSTLLNVISGRTDPGSGVRAVAGAVRVDEVPFRPRDLSRRVAFVPQRDAHMLPFLTVFETVMYSAELQLPWYTPRDEKRARTMATLEELALTRVANSRVGGADAGSSAGGGGRGGGGGDGGAVSRVVRAGVRLLGTACRRRPRVDTDGTVPGNDDDPEMIRVGDGPGASSVSGGERRRVAVAMELVTSPDIIALDEPTSGLDAAAATAMVFTLRDLASRGAGRVVVLSVHQPSPRAFRALDRVLLLGAGGIALWYGSPSRAEAHFAAVGLPCPEEDLAAFARADEGRAVKHRRGDATVESSNRGEPRGARPGARYRVDVSEWMLEVASDPTARETLIAGGSQTPPRSDVAKVSSDPSGDAPAGTDGVGSRGIGPDASSGGRPSSAATEFRVLLARSAATTTRDPSLFVAHLTVATLTAILLGCIYLDSPRTLAGFQNRAGGIFFTLVFFGLASASAGDRLAAEAVARDREIRSGYHGAGSYVLAALVVDILALRTPAAAVYAVVLYHMMGLRAGADAFFTFLGLLELFVAAAASLCAAVSLAARNPAVSNLIATFTLLLSAMFGGFLVSIRSVPPALRWLQWLSPYRYAWGAMLSNEMRDAAFLFDTDFEGAAVKIEVDGQTYLNTFGIHPRTIARDAGALAGIIGGLGVLAYLALGATTGGWRCGGTGESSREGRGGRAKRRG